jgi:hypothetical protein
LSNPEWYERFITKVDVGEAIGVTLQHKVRLEYVAQELYNHAFTDDDRSLASTASSVAKIKKDLKSIKKAFTTFNSQLAQSKEDDSDIYDSEGDEEASHFQVDQAFQLSHFNKKFEPRIAKLFKQAGSSIKLDLREVILLNSQSTMDLFCNAALVSKTRKSNSSMRLEINGGTMVVTCKATMLGYTKTV